ncbi:hypothetical protein KC950_03670 [Candidatus Saccharibacteria bacterium]|nr:hypothetical protein [Candidatus Saccharibacteria bacterium]
MHRIKLTCPEDGDIEVLTNPFGQKVPPTIIKWGTELLQPQLRYRCPVCKYVQLTELNETAVKVLEQGTDINTQHLESPKYETPTNTDTICLNDLLNFQIDLEYISSPQDTNEF